MRLSVFSRLTCALALALGAGIAAGGVQATLTASAAETVPTEPLIIEGESGTIIDGVRIMSRDGDCITIRNSTNITIRNSVIGPCRGIGIAIEGGSGTTVSNNVIQTQHKPRECCDEGDGIFALSTANLSIDGNKIAYSETNIELMSVQGARITNNALANPLGPFPRGQQIQVASREDLPPTRDVVIEDNTMIASRSSGYKLKENQEDAINVFLAEDVVIRDNVVQGGRSGSGCGILADHGSNRVQISSNRVFNTAQCGIGIASGEDQTVDSNRVLLEKPVKDAGNTAIYVWNQSEVPCSNVRVANNVAVFVLSNGAHNSFWDGGGCDPVTVINNTWDEAAYGILRAEFLGLVDGIRPEFIALSFPGEDEANPLLIPGALVLAVAAIVAAVFAGKRLRARRPGR